MIFILHGKGTGNYSDASQSWLTKKYEDKRKKGLTDKTKLTTDELNLYEISGADGTGRTNCETYQVEQFPFPTDPTIRKKITVDMRKVDKKIGDPDDII